MSIAERVDLRKLRWMPLWRPSLKKRAQNNLPFGKKSGDNYERISKNFPHCNSKSYSYAMETGSAVLKLPCYSINVRELCANFSHPALSCYARAIGKPHYTPHARSSCVASGRS